MSSIVSLTKIVNSIEFFLYKRNLFKLIKNLMEVITSYLKKFDALLRNLSVLSKKLIICSAISASASYIFYYIFIRKKKDNPPKTTFKTTDCNEITLKKSQIDFAKRKIQFGGFNYFSSNSKNNSNKNKKAFKLNNPMKKIENQRSNVVKSDQVFYNILSKFSSFILRNKFAFAFA